jgi:hypothetical protein
MIHTALVSTRLQMHPSGVHSVVGEWHRSLSPLMVPSHYVRFGRRLWLATKPQLRSPDPLQLYAVRGVLWLNGRPIRVGLEFSTWSATTTQLAIRPDRLAWPVSTERYANRVRELLDGLIGSVAERAAFHPEYGEETQIPISRGYRNWVGSPSAAPPSIAPTMWEIGTNGVGNGFRGLPIIPE